ncbi:hypothetical protein RvY_00905-2 [Ramazzottius varieornatus]|uniref:Uncharacterized protein n=1 Tax=Ramazzottius varieornatus TaxID=947166 RepID=A0A1D1ULL4_RAMVA|nr:hypothetical protein RvY_00905-2 [Ramazzottius varieornatus]
MNLLNDSYRRNLAQVDRKYSINMTPEQGRTRTKLTLDVALKTGPLIRTRKPCSRNTEEFDKEEKSMSARGPMSSQNFFPPIRLQTATRIVRWSIVVRILHVQQT